MNIVLVYPGKDKLPNGPGTEWIEQLEANLNLVLKKYSEKPLEILTPGKKIPREIFAGAHGIILLMHVSYTSSEEYLGFLESITAGSSDTRKSCIRIDTSLQDAEKLPEQIADAVSIRLANPGTGESELLGEDSPVYWSRLLDLAAEMEPMTEPQENQGEGQVGDAVYLAQTSADMGSSRNILKRELTEYGFRVLPTVDLKYQKSDLKSTIQSLVDKSRLAIHLIGNTYGEVMKETGYSISEVQIQYITEYLEAIENDPVHASKEINRLIWIDPEFNPLDSQQEEFIMQLKRNIENLHRTEIIQTPLELFKTLIINKLRHKGVEQLRDQGEKEEGKKYIYLLHSPDDQSESVELVNKLSGNGIHTGMLDYGKPQVELLKDHKMHLQECDGAIVFYGNTNRPWLNSKVMDLLKAPGLGRKHKLESRQVLAAKNDRLEDFSLPAGISLTREPDLSRAVDQLIENLK